ncbi:LysR family transcriptional regulator [Amorphus sp. 3PC139-8]|uniref:LysR family transcriptional regulator n=1 Tax=Amorphus sp. 3PC139-8 TaxID=2735676 RepID=UPI00345CC984
MDVRDLKSLIAIAETGSLSAAARRLNVTQPALSMSLRRLEAELSVTLVRRHSRGAELTEEGRYVLQKAYDILHEMAEITSVVSNLAEEPVGHVRLGLPTTVAGGLIPELLPLLRARYPQIKIHIVEAMSGVLAELLHLGRLDLVVMFDIQPMAGLRSEPLLLEKLQFLAPPGHPLARSGKVRLEEVVQLGLVLPGRDHTIRRYIENSCHAEGLALNAVADIDSLPGLINLVKTGHCTILPTYLVRDHIREGTIVPVEITRPELEWTLHLATRHDATRPRASMATARLVVEICTNLVQRGAWPGRLPTAHGISA